MNRLLLLLLFAFIFFNTKAQRGQLDSLASGFIKHIRSNSREKMVAITDKSFYMAGESLWFRVWTLDSTSHRPAHHGKFIFADLVDNNDSVVNQLLLSNEDGKTMGTIHLASSLKEGYYWFRAYKNSMLQRDSNSVFVKPIYILNESKPNPKALSLEFNKAIQSSPDTGAPRLEFYPEGGSIISGTTANVAFRASNPSGTPINVDGFVTDTRNDTVARFSTSFAGAGVFSFDAFNPRRYTAHVKGKNNQLYHFPLPRINQSAYQLSVVEQNDQIFHMRVSLGDSLYKKNKTSYILGISRDSLCFAANGNDMYEVNVPTGNFPQGKAILYLFDDKFQLVSERAIYVNRESQQVEAATDNASYGFRQKVALKLKMIGNLSSSSVSSMAVSVIENRVGVQGEDLIFWHYLINDNIALLGHTLSEFEQADAKKRDVYMLLQPDTYENWVLGLDRDLPTGIGSSDTMDIFSVRGRILNKKNEPLRNYIVNLFSEDNSIFKIDTTNENGGFKITLPEFMDGTRFNLKLTNLKGLGQDGTLLVDKSDLPHFHTPLALKRVLGDQEIAAIRSLKAKLPADSSYFTSGAQQLKPVVVKKDKNPPLNYDASKRVSLFSTIITAESFNKADQNAIVNAVANVPGFNAGFNTMTFSGSYGVQPLVILDGVIMSLSSDVKSFLATLEQTNIDFIEILKPALATQYGMQGAGGVILINTINKRKEMAVINEKGYSELYPKGVYHPDLFLAPDYDKKDVLRSAQADNRYTLYWEGNLLTDHNGDAITHFFTGDTRSTFEINVYGVTQNGIVFFINREFKVQ